MPESRTTPESRAQPAGRRPPRAPRLRAARRIPWWLGLPVALAVLVALLAALVRVDLLPGPGDLLDEKTTDRSGPALLRSVRDLSRYQAAEGNFQVVVDLDKDAAFLPDSVRGKRTLYVGAGTVPAYVDLGKVADGGVQVNDDRTAATLWLPHARLGSPALDPDRSYAVTKQRGILDRLGDFFSDNPNDEREVNRLAAQHIAAAARDAGLTTRAERNTTAMLEGLLHSLGFGDVTVHYGRTPPSSANSGKPQA
ncbi:DUF4230 domain-containing protein [Streptomyces polyrhachis]|uniref:DUF4230 domain-containing protein n=1 Tax=Streptomyces polyrhachis TaxID=1282885 RepID=A0ABW2GK43_9ACTN